MWQPIESLAIVAAVGGALLAGRRLFRPRAGSPSSRPGEQGFEAVAFGYLLLATLGIVLADGGIFSAPMLAGGTWLVWVATRMSRVVPAKRRAPEPNERAWGWAGFLLAAVLVVGLCAPVFDTRLEARDPGVYRLAAADLHRTGSMAYYDKLVAQMPAAVRDQFFPYSALSPGRSMGFYLDGRETGRVVPQFMPLAPVLMAIARAAGGSRATGYATVVAAFVAALAMFFLARRLAGTLAATLAVLWLSGNLANWWFVRYGAAEPFAQALVLIACYAMLVERERDSAPHGAMAGWALGLAWLAKLELLLLVGPLALLFVVDALTGRLRRRSTQAFWGALVALAALFFAHAWGWARPYVHDVLLVPGTDLQSVTLVAALGLVVAVAMFFWSRSSPAVPWPHLAAVASGEGVVGRGCRGVLAVAVVFMLIYGYWFRAPGWDQDNLRALGWVISNTGLVLGAVGVLYLLLAKTTAPGVGAVVALLLPVAAVTLWNKQITPGMLWAYRRYLVVVLPLTVLGAAVVLGGGAQRAIDHLRAGRRGPQGWSRVGAGVALVTLATLAMVMSMQIWNAGAPYRRSDELRGSDVLIRELDEVFEPQALVIFEPRNKRGLIRLEGAVQHELDRDVIRMTSLELDNPAIRHVILTASRAGQPIYLVTSAYGYVRGAAWLDAEPVAALQLDTERLEEIWFVLPTRTERVVINARIYRLRAGGPRAETAGRLDVGSGFDDLYVDGSTMYEVETSDDERDFRWTGQQGRLYLRGMEAGTRRILIRMSSGYPPSAGEQRATVLLDGMTLGEVVVGRGWTDYSFEVPASWRPRPGGMPQLEINAEPTWQPEKVLASDDPRSVGVAIDLIRWGE